MKKLLITTALSMSLFSTSIVTAQTTAAYAGQRQGVNAAAIAIGAGVVITLGVVGIIVNNNSNNSSTASSAHSH